MYSRPLLSNKIRERERDSGEGGGVYRIDNSTHPELSIDVLMEKSGLYIV